MTEQQAAAANRKFNIQIDREHYVVHQAEMTGSELRAVPPADIPADRDLFEVVPGHPDRKIENNDIVEIRNGLRFFTAPATINPGMVVVPAPLIHRRTTREPS
jgi:Multiubiquitin